LTTEDKVNQAEELVQRFAEALRGQMGRSENTVRVYTTDLRPYLAFLEQEDQDVRGLDRRHLRRYLAWLSTSARGKDGGYARVSVARKLVALRAFYRYLTQEGIVPKNPIPRGRTFNIKVEKRLPVFLGREEAERLVENPDVSQPLGMRDRAILELLYSSGIRLSELHDMDTKDLNMTTSEARVIGKGSKERVVLLGKPAVESIALYIRSARPYLAGDDTDDALFLNRYGGRLSRRSIETIVSRYAALAATRPDVHPHTLRHTFATHMVEGGADLRVVQDLMGHSSPATTQIYTHVTMNEARAEYMTTHPRAGLKVSALDVPNGDVRNIDVPNEDSPEEDDG
jgi:integrase/recombinase XerC